jgi:hypothetical protein
VLEIIGRPGAVASVVRSVLTSDGWKVIPVEAVPTGLPSVLEGVLDWPVAFCSMLALSLEANWGLTYVSDARRRLGARDRRDCDGRG